MKTAHEIAVGIKPTDVPVVAPRQIPQQIDSGTARVVNALFQELQAIFPAWRQAWPDDKALAAAKKSWIKGFMAADITKIEQIRYGLEQCRADGCVFVPSVGQFIAWCRPTAEMLGLPELDKAYREAVTNSHPAATPRWSHPAVHHAACETGFYALNHLQEEQSRKLFARNYEATVRMVMAGEPLREIPKALPTSVSVSTPAVGRKALAELRSKINGIEIGSDEA